MQRNAIRYNFPTRPVPERPILVHIPNEVEQPFRLEGETDIMYLPCFQDDGQYYIFLDDIMEVFPSVSSVMDGEQLVPFVRDSNLVRIEPLRILYHPGVVLDVIVASERQGLSGGQLDTVESRMLEIEEAIKWIHDIQWEYLRYLHICGKPRTYERAMEAIVDGAKEISGKVDLEWFVLESETDEPLPMPQEEHLQIFLASTSIQIVKLKVDMTLEQILSLLRSANFSRLKELILWCGDFDSLKVDAILDGLQHATELQLLTLEDANITDEQKEREKAKGVHLSR
ncbi:MAG: hypothetical protein J3Q66DRAFT_331445 [Benniella sp.]|nr:MAG: hypothetical protein J3Q66DRAFT_331445 [Benniella sp.]